MNRHILLRIAFIALLASMHGCKIKTTPEVIKDPVYLLARMQEQTSGIELVALVETASSAECETRNALIIFKGCASCNITETSCLRELLSRFQAVWDEQGYHASYMIFEQGSVQERNGRLIFFHVPSSEVTKARPAMQSAVKKNYSGNMSSFRAPWVTLTIAFRTNFANEYPDKHSISQNFFAKNGRGDGSMLHVRSPRLETVAEYSVSSLSARSGKDREIDHNIFN